MIAAEVLGSSFGRLNRADQAVGEDRQIAAQHDMRREARHRLGRDTVEQVTDESLKGRFSLRERPLVKSCENSPRLQERDEFGEEVGGHHQSVAQRPAFLQSAEN